MSDHVGKRSGLYERISDDREGLELGVGRQDEDLRAAAARAGDVVVDTYADNDISASTRSRKVRPDYQRLLTDARAGRIDKIWAYTSSRLTRRPLELEGQIELAERYGIEFAYLRSPSFDLNTANGRMIARMLAAKDANESEETSERIIRTFAQKREKGEHLGGGRLFGWEIDGVTPRVAEQAALAQASEDVLVGVSLYEIMTDWNRSGPATSRGNKWSVVTVRQVLVRPRNAGLILHNGEIVGRFPWYDTAPVTEETWAAVCAILTDPARNDSPGNKPRWLGTGLYVCWGCERPSLRGGKAANQKRLYRCDLRVDPLEGRRHVARQAYALDAYVEELVVARLCRADAVDLAREDRSSVDVRALHAERRTVRASLDTLDDDLDAGHIDRPRWLRRNTSLKARLAEIDQQLAPVSRVNPFAGVADADDPALVWYGSRADRSDGLSLEHRRAILAALMTVTVLPVRAKRAPFDAGCIDIERLR